jgi:D-alanyl-D-alanine carboxypeptidase
MKKLIPFAFLALCLKTVVAQPVTDPTFDPTFATALQSALQVQGTSLAIRNLSACVFVPGQGTWVGVYNAPGFPALPTDARFGIASNSKAFVAGLCLRLKSEGLLDLDVPVSTYLPNISTVSPFVNSSITTRQLLNHQAGLFDFYNQASDATLDIFDANPDRLWKPAEILATIGTPNHAPGASYAYSNTHFLVAAMVCEAITGKTFGQLLQEKIAQPLGLSRTNYPAGGDNVSNSAYAPLYSSAGTAVSLNINRANSFWSTIQAAGGIASTPWDMVKWYRSGLFEKIVSPAAPGTLFDYETQKELFEVEPWSSYSLGLRALNGSQGGSFLYHAGAWGYRSYMMHDQETGITICVLGNQYGKSVGTVGNALYATVRAQLPRKIQDLEVLTVLEPSGQVCAPGKLALRLRNTGLAPIESAVLNVNVEPNCCTPPQTVQFSPALQPGATRDWESANTYSDITTGIGQLNVDMSAGAGNYPFRAAEKSFFVRSADWNQSVVQIPYREDFSNLKRGQLPKGWVSYQPNNVQDWRTSHFAGRGGALCKNNYNDDASGKAYLLELPMMLLPGSAQISFDYAYAPFPGVITDSLYLEISSDCGERWQTIWQNGAATMQTATAINTSFLPSNSVWRTVSIVAPGSSAGTVNILRFKAVNRLGNNVWLDNISVSPLVSTYDVAALSSAQFSPNPMQTHALLRLENPVEAATLTVFDVLGRTVIEKRNCSGDMIALERNGLSGGAYFFTLREKDRLVARGKLVAE